MVIDKSEVLRYLGHRGQNLEPEMECLLDEMIALCRSLARPRWIHRRMELVREETGMLLHGSSLRLEGGDIARHLQGTGEVAVMAVTLGHPLEQHIHRLEVTDITRSLVLDAAATTLVEAACDSCQEEINEAIMGEGLTTGPRFSPGYGDLPLAIQPGILALLNAERRIGLTCTDSLILLPRKSVTAVVGLFPQGHRCGKQGVPCALCGMAEDCNYRKRGTLCGNQ